MNKHLLFVPGLIVMVLLSMSTAHASDLKGYAGLQLGAAEVESEDLNFGLLRIGIKNPSNFAAEVRYGTGAGSATSNGVETEINRILGFYGAYYWDLSDSVSLYGILGWSELVLGTSTATGSDEEDEDSISYGIGAEFHGFNVELMQYLKSDNVDARALAIGYNYHFD